MYGALWDDCIAAMLSAQPLHGFQEEHFPVCGVNAHAQQAALALSFNLAGIHAEPVLLLQHRHWSVPAGLSHIADL